ncbi:hypothetical protein BDP27DRAFT_1429556 [Rhodocollybia butyracea]|uniref:Uncharacterized protein n=1 Tax=Rhodocollybia butyracea TaxID=206335 RepID=A0A9P5PCM6_9AGAR|nr:hypothetical protein BDP27DRAFT_1429556 [Rhodocollybia butyracea]
MPQCVHTCINWGKMSHTEIQVTRSCNSASTMVTLIVTTCITGSPSSQSDSASSPPSSPLAESDLPVRVDTPGPRLSAPNFQPNSQPLGSCQFTPTVQHNTEALGARVALSGPADAQATSASNPQAQASTICTVPSGPSEANPQAQASSVHTVPVGPAEAQAILGSAGGQLTSSPTTTPQLFGVHAGPSGQGTTSTGHNLVPRPGIPFPHDIVQPAHNIILVFPYGLI